MRVSVVNVSGAISNVKLHKTYRYIVTAVWQSKCEDQSGLESRVGLLLAHQIVRTNVRNWIKLARAKFVLMSLICDKV